MPTVDLELARRRHRQERAHLRTAHTAERDMGKARHVHIIIFVGSRPPPFVLVILVQVGAHDIERCHRHQAMRHDSAGVADGEIGRADHRIDITRQLPGMDLPA